MRPSVEPLARRSAGVARRKLQLRRYSPFDGSPKNGNARTLRDSKSLYKFKLQSPGQVVQTPGATTTDTEGSSLATMGSPSGYQPAIQRLSSLLDINMKGTIGEFVETSDGSDGLRIPMAEINLNEAPKSVHCEPAAPMADKEAMRQPRLKVAATHLARSDTARRRSRLMQNQQLPTVVVRPPSGASFGEHSASVWLPSLSEAL